MVTETGRDFRKEVVNFLKQIRIDREHDKTEQLKEIWRNAGEKGLLDTSISRKYGGKGRKDYSVILLEELGNHLMLDYPFWLQTDVIGYLIETFGSEQQKELLFEMCKGRKIGAFALTEIQGGSNFDAFQSVVRKDRNSYVLNGGKCFISNATIADFFLVAAKYKEDGVDRLCLILLEKNSQGLECAPHKNIRAMHDLDFGEIRFDYVEIHSSNFLGQQIKDLRLGINMALLNERFSVSIICFNMSKRVLNEIINWAKSRSIGSGLLIENSYFKGQLAKYYAENRIIEEFLGVLKFKFVNDKKLTSEEVAVAKYKSVNHLSKISEFAIKTLGARAFTPEYGSVDFVKVNNDALAQSIAGGTDEIMLKIISDYAAIRGDAREQTI